MLTRGVHPNEAHLLVQELISRFQSSVNSDVHSAHEHIYVTFDLGLMPSLTHTLFQLLALLLTRSSTYLLTACFCLQSFTVQR